MSLTSHILYFPISLPNQIFPYKVYCKFQYILMDKIILKNLFQ